MSSKVNLRDEQIMKILLLRGNVSVTELAEEIGMADYSIRRDLNRLEKRGLVRRNYGGVGVVEPAWENLLALDDPSPTSDSAIKHIRRRIGFAAAELVQRGENVGISAGRTTTHVARALRHRTDISVVTNGLNIGMELCNQSAIRTTLVGGTVAMNQPFAMTGRAAVNCISDVNFDKLFVGATGIDPSRGVTTRDMDEAAVVRAMVESTGKLVVVTDSSKFGKVSAAKICSLSDVDILITDKDPPPEMRRELENFDVQIIVV